MGVKMMVLPKFKHVTLALGLVGLPFLVTGCAGGDQEDTGDIMTNTENGGDDNASASGDEGNSSSAGSGEESASGSGGDESNTVATADDAAVPQVDLPSNSPSTVAEQAPARAAPAAAPAASAPAVPTSAQAPIAGGRVRYAKESGTKVTSQAGGGQVVRTLDQGDHPLTWEEGGFYKIGNGMYVTKEAMSDAGVPRSTVSQAH